MKRSFFLAALAVCLALTACGRARPPAPQPDVPPAFAPADRPADGEPMSLGILTVELVVVWEEADRLLESLDQLSGLLSKALVEQGCAPEEVRVTLSTAGGVTADALAEGGVDAAWLPAEDFASCGDRAIAALSQDTGGGVAAVTAAREELDGSFRELLARAVLDTEPGREFTQLCYPGAAYIPAPEAQSQEADHGE